MVALMLFSLLQQAFFFNFYSNAEGDDNIVVDAFYFGFVGMNFLFCCNAESVAAVAFYFGFTATSFFFCCNAEGVVVVAFYFGFATTSFFLLERRRRCFRRLLCYSKPSFSFFLL
jgi:hypothetical protein